MDKYDIRGRKLVVKPDFDGHHSSKFRRRKEQDMRAHALLTPQLLQSLSLDPDCLSDTVFVANLFYKMDWRDIKDVFRVAGNVERVEVFKDKDERSKGLAVVKFESVVDAVNAICMLNGRMLHNRELLVRMNREKNLNQREREPPKPKPVPIPRGLESMGPSLEQIAQGIHTGPGNMGGGRMGGNIGMGGGGSLGGGGIGGGGGGLGGGLGGFQGLGGGLGSGLGGGLGSGGLGGGLGGD
ncbi:putative myelin expression factor 2 [Apostichopus japonicus]|uniref:Putative myelin expression factor 2 n=1 Tax=Stichopus japonicus TaxID=307972 RepID=A0A2G8JPB7_STIJA|nr:putative myelin expression factor 2 [Apostichopus japonicus]